MATVISHAIAAMALKSVFSGSKVPSRLLFLGAAFSMAPDLDVISFRLGIAYGELWGHRGMTHSLLFAAVLGLVGTWVAFPRKPIGAHRGWVWLYLALATASHGLLDALTDGGLGVAFFAPFFNQRYFFPIAPIAVSPIGITRFFADGGWQVLVSEFGWIWLPSILLVAVAWGFRRWAESRNQPIAGAGHPLE